MLQTNDIVKLDAICNEFVANLRAGDDSNPVIKLKPPYNMMTELDEMSSGRSKANNFEPYILSLLYTLNKIWDTTKYEKETAPIVAAIDELESPNQIKGKIYAY
jgi:hypothetical protein